MAARLDFCSSLNALKASLVCPRYETPLRLLVRYLLLAKAPSRVAKTNLRPPEAVGNDTQEDTKPLSSAAQNQEIIG